jgi:hypothetical protein
LTSSEAVVTGREQNYDDDNDNTDTQNDDGLEEGAGGQRMLLERLFEVCRSLPSMTATAQWQQKQPQDEATEREEGNTDEGGDNDEEEQEDFDMQGGLLFASSL